MRAISGLDVAISPVQTISTPQIPALNLSALQQIQDTLGSHNEHYNEPLRVLDGGNLFAISHSPTMSNRSKAIGENQSNTN